MSNEFWDEFESLLDKSEPEPIEYRVHYNTAGEIYLCTMQEHPQDTVYLVVTKAEYDRYYDYYVVEKHLKKKIRDAGYHVQLRKSDKGYPTVKGHANIILEEEYPEVEYYEYRNS
jgi:hypothetical protein